MYKLKFIRYPSILYKDSAEKRDWFDEELKEEWAVTEKLHGKNMAYYYSSEEGEAIANRNGFDRSLSLNLVLDSIKENSKSLMARFDDPNNKVDYMIVYGELYGYGIQGTYYKENINKTKGFRIFDVAFIYKEGAKVLLPWETVYNSFWPEELVPTLAIGKLANLLKEPISEESMLGGPSEGVVYKDFSKMSWIASYADILRIKSKTKNYQEITPKYTEPKEWHDLEERITDELGMFINQNRVNDIFSHGYTVSETSIQPVLDETLEDIITDYSKYFKEKEGYLPEDINYQRLLRRYVPEIVSYIKEFIKERNEEK